MGEDIWSESQFIYHMVKDILLLPLTLILVLSKKKEPIHLLQPLKDVWKFLTEAKMVFWIIMFNIFVFVGVRVILYMNGFGLFDDVIAGIGFGDFFANTLYENVGFNIDLVNFQVENLLAFSTGSLFQHPIYIIPFFLTFFTHSSFSHLFGNILGLFIFGRVLERKLNASKVLFLYLAIGIVSSFLRVLLDTFIFHQDAIMNGASTVVFGFIAIAIVLSPFYISYETLFPFPITILGLGALTAELANLVGAINTGGDTIGHMIGFFSALGMIIYMYKDKLKDISLGIVFSIITLLLSLVLFFGFGKIGLPPVELILKWVGF